MLPDRYYHVTERTDAALIMEEGFQGGWGDVGLGVYVYASRIEAESYAKKGGWDGRLRDPVLLLIEDATLERVMPQADWPAEKYENMYWKDMEDGDEEAFWKPTAMHVITDFSVTLKPQRFRRSHP